MSCIKIFFVVNNTFLASAYNSQEIFLAIKIKALILTILIRLKSSVNLFFIPIKTVFSFNKLVTTKLGIFGGQDAHPTINVQFQIK